MIAKRITDMSEMLKLVPIEVKLRNKEKSETKTKEMLEFVQKMLPNPMFYPVIIYDDTESTILGYMMILVIADKVMDMQAINVLRVWREPHHKEVNQLILDILKVIADKTNIHKVRMATKGRERAFKKTWGFETKATLMERRI